MATTYYVSPGGSDSNAGTSPSSPWQSVAQVDDSTFQPGDQILFQDGGNWYGSLDATSSGTAAAPITYGTYGSERPADFLGQQHCVGLQLPARLGATDTYTYASTTPVTSFFVNHQFTHSASLVSGQTTDSGNISYVEKNPNTWYYDATNSQLYVNDGAAISSGNGQTYTVAVRSNAISSNSQNNLIFNNLATDETAAFGGGYGIDIIASNNVTVLDCTALNGGKHNVGIIDSNATVTGTTASGVMPDQGTGGATAFVSYSDQFHPGGTSVYNNDTVTNYPGQDAFYDHADNAAALVSITLNNFTTTSPVSIGLGGSDQVAVNGGTFINTQLTAAGNSIINGAKLIGPNSSLTFSGTNNVAENILIAGDDPSNNYDAAVIDQGTNDILRYSTIVMAPSTPDYYVGVVETTANSNLQVYGNIIDGPAKAFTSSAGGVNATFAYNDFLTGIYEFNTNTTLAQLQAGGYDVGSVLGNPLFYNPANGNYYLSNGSPAIGLVPLNANTSGDPDDIDGLPRATSGFTDAGAFLYGDGIPPLIWNNSDASGDGRTWDGTSLNWSIGGSTTAYADGFNAVFDDSNNANYAVTLNATVKPASVLIYNSLGNYTFSGAGSIGGTGSLTKSGTATATLSTVNTYTGGTNVTGGTLVVGVNGALPNGKVTISGGTLQLAAGTGLAQMTSLSITGGGTLDVNNNRFILSYTGISPISTIASYIASGYDGGAWNGAGIGSSAAAVNPHYGLGYADGADGVVAGLSSGQIEVAYTLYGDANLDGVVNGTDFGILSANFGKAVTGWDKGDFSYNGVVNGTDFGPLAANFGQQANGAAVQLPASDWTALDSFAAANGLLADVPEPASAGFLLAAGLGFLTRRRRRNLPTRGLPTSGLPTSVGRFTTAT